MKPTPHPLILAAHKNCTANCRILSESSRAGCFYCLQIFSPSDITEWIPDAGDPTALCPHCGIDAVLPESDACPLTPAFLKEMQEYWFSPA